MLGHLGLVLGAAHDDRRALDAAALAGHALDEVFGQHPLGHLQQGDLALLDAGTGQGAGLHSAAHLLEGLAHRRRHAAAGGEAAAKAAGVVQGRFGHLGHVDVLGGQHGVQLLKGDNQVDGRAGTAQVELPLLGHARADEHHTGQGVPVLDIPAQHDHGGGGGGHLGHHVGHVTLHIGHEGRAAGGGHGLAAPLVKLRGLRLGGEVGPQGHLAHVIEAHLLQGGHHLAGGAVELAHKGGGQDGVDVQAPLVRAHEHLDHVHDVGLVHNGAEGALDHALAAGDALAGVDAGLAVRTHGDCLDGTAPLAGTHVLGDGAVGAGGHALAAQHAFGVVDDGAVVLNADGALGAGLHAAVGDAAPAGGAYADLGDGALVAGDGQHLYQVGVGPVAPHGHLDPAAHHGPLLVDAAAHLGLGAGDDLLGYVQNFVGLELVVPGQTGHGGKYLVLQLLDGSFVMAHGSSSFSAFKIMLKKCRLQHLHYIPSPPPASRIKRQISGENSWLCCQRGEPVF